MLHANQSVNRLTSILTEFQEQITTILIRIGRYLAAAAPPLRYLLLNTTTFAHRAFSVIF